MNAPTKSDNPNVLGLKHMAFAVNDAKAGARSLFEVPVRARRCADHRLPKSRNRVALFNLGGVEYQLCQSMDAEAGSRAGSRSVAARACTTSATRSTTSRRRCDTPRRTARACANAKPARCSAATRIPEGYVAFLDNDAGGIEIEFMQVYTPEELAKYNAVKGI